MGVEGRGKGPDWHRKPSQFETCCLRLIRESVPFRNVWAKVSQFGTVSGHDWVKLELFWDMIGVFLGILATFLGHGWVILGP